MADGVKYFCRSSLELQVLCYFIEHGYKFQISKHRIPYVNDEGICRTYCPDIVINDIDSGLPIIYEIKPHAMILLRKNQVKNNAAREYCKRFGLVWGNFITERSFDLTKYDSSYIMNLIGNKSIIIDEKNIEKLKRNII